MLRDFPGVEFNIEGNPFEGKFLELIRQVRPTQSTLVPDAPDAFTSDSGWDVSANRDRLTSVIPQLKESGARVSLFMDAGTTDLAAASEIGADRIELYTEPYAAAWSTPKQAETTGLFRRTAEEAQKRGLGVNAGHDLNQKNLSYFLQNVPGVLEVSIGHALIGEALFEGLDNTVRAYLQICKQA